MRACTHRGERENLKQNPQPPSLSVEPTVGFDPTTQDHDLSQNHELEAELTEQPGALVFDILDVMVLFVGLSCVWYPWP